ncbi:MAG: AAA family ATPase [Phycisphaeraceae bacterium]
MRTIAIINQKGGCGKTTTAINLSAVLAEHGERTLLVDMDPQSHCALGLAVPEAQIERHIGDILRAGLDGSIGFSDIVWQIARNLDLAPCTMALAGLEAELAAAPDRDRRMQQVLSTVRDKYDFCIIDCPPSIGLLTFNALRAADEVIVPVETGYFAMHGSIKQEKTIDMLARRAGHHVRFKALATMYDVRTKLAREILAELRRQFGDRLLPVVVHFNSKLKEAASFGQAITEYDPGSRGYQDFEKLVSWLKSNPPEVPGVDEIHEPVGAAAGGIAGPALSRAAELVERARALSQRTAQLAAKITTDPDVARERAAQPPKPAPAELPMPAMPARTPSLSEKLAKLYGVRHTSQGLLFVQPLDGSKHQVAIAGDFNNWNPQSTPLRQDDRLNVWQACVPVPPGRYRYRLVVDGKWQQDPFNNYVESNPFGELNNVVEVDVEG